MKPKARLLIGSALALLCMILFLFLFFKDHSQNITQKEFQSLLENASRFEVDSNYLYFWNQNKAYRLLKDDQILSQVKEHFPIQTRQVLMWPYYLALFLAVCVLAGLYLAYQRKKTIQSSPKSLGSNPKVSTPISPTPISSKITFDSLAGLSAIKKDLLEIIDYLKNPKKYRSLGLRMPKGVLLVGPPGVGKTMLAKAIASQAGVPFFYQSGSSFAQIFVGSGAKKVEELFTQAKQCQSAIIFIDELDSVGKMRGNGRNDEREATLNQLLIEMDGFNTHSNLLIFGATNNAEVLDSALLRSGRFDRKIYIDLPTPKEREEIFKLYLQNKSYDFNLESIAKECSGFSGAMIENLINEAGLLMLRANRSTLLQTDLLQAKQTLIFSLKKIPTLTQNQREVLSLYQSAKALCAYQFHIEFEKIALWDEESVYNIQDFLSKTQLFELLKFYLSGNEALKLFKGEGYTCAKEDLKKAKQIASDCFNHYGMGEHLLSHNIEPLISQAQRELCVFLETHKEKILTLHQQMLQFESLAPKQCDALF